MYVLSIPETREERLFLSATRLRRAADLVGKVNQKKFDIVSFGRKVNDAPKCGTTFCVAGHCGLTESFRREGLRFEWEETSSQEWSDDDDRPDPIFVTEGRVVYGDEYNTTYGMDAVEAYFCLDSEDEAMEYFAPHDSDSRKTQRNPTVYAKRLRKLAERKMKERDRLLKKAKKKTT